jgi:hypothetical protein
MRGSRFLIGAGSNCDLQLGGTAIPILHSLIVRDAASLRIEALVPEPALRVAGRTVRETVLHEDELVEIGPFSLVVHSGLPAADDLPADLAGPLDIPSLLAQQERHVEWHEAAQSLTAAELVDRLQAEVVAVEHLERRRQAGMDALLQSVRALSLPAGHDPLELDATIMRLERLARDIEARSQRLRESERELEERADVMRGLQDRLEREMQEFLLAADGEESDSLAPLRLSA